MNCLILLALIVMLPCPSHCINSTDNTTNETKITLTPLVTQLDQILLHDTYASTFRLRDGSTLSSIDSEALNAMRGSVQRLLAVGDNSSFLNHTRTLPDGRLLSILLLAVAGNFTVDQSPSALPQKCGIVVDSGSGALMLRDNAAAQSVILEVLLIVSIVCLVRAWGAGKAQNK